MVATNCAFSLCSTFLEMVQVSNMFIGDAVPAEVTCEIGLPRGLESLYMYLQLMTDWKFWSETLAAAAVFLSM